MDDIWYKYKKNRANAIFIFKFHMQSIGRYFEGLKSEVRSVPGSHGIREKKDIESSDQDHSKHEIKDKI